MKSRSELRALVVAALEDYTPSDELGSLREPLRYAVGGKLLRPVLCLAAAESLGVTAEEALPAALAVELVHSFSLVHDDLPALDDDTERRGKPTVHREFGERTAILVGDALVAEAFRLAATYDTPAVARELATATVRMIGGQQLDFEGVPDRAAVHALKTAAMFEAPVGCALALAGVAEQDAWRAFARELGLLFQVVDDVLDGDGFAAELGEDGARRLAEGHAARVEELLAQLPGDTSVLRELADTIATRTA